MHKVLWAALFIIFAALAGLVLTPGNAFAETTGTIGSNLTYIIDDSGKMTISGSGDMPNYDDLSARPYNGQVENIIEIEIGDGVTSIGDYAFYDCTGLESVTIPESVTSIGNGAFSSCESLESVIIPESVTSIGNKAFSFCKSLESVTIPESVTSIGSNAFLYCESLKSVTIPNGVASIDSYTFSGCESLESVTIPDSVTSIGECAFVACYRLTSIELPEGLESIGQEVFVQCVGLTSITIPDSVTSIGKLAFQRCINLTSIELPEGLKSIDQGAFYSCSSLTSITIPSSVTSIGQDAFSYCSALETVILPEDLELGGNTSLSADTTQVTYTVSDGKVTITGVELGDDKTEVAIGDTVNGMPVVGVAEDFRDFVSDRGHKHRGGTATCTEKAVCVICGNEYGNEKHEEESIPAVPATCTTTGATAGVKCSLCGKVLTAPATISATGHSYVNGKCRVCGTADPDYKPGDKPEEKPEEKPDNKPGDGTDDKPEEKPGETTHTHSARGGWQYDSGSHWKTCGECGEVLERENHDFAWVIDRKPTEETEGLRHRECSVCGYARAEVSIPALGSDEDADAAMREDDALPEEAEEQEKADFDNTEHTDNPQTGGTPLTGAVLLAAGALGALLCGRRRRG